jgi:hypothetical protein
MDLGPPEGKEQLQLISAYEYSFILRYPLMLPHGAAKHHPIPEAQLVVALVCPARRSKALVYAVDAPDMPSSAINASCEKCSVM